MSAPFVLLGYANLFRTSAHSKHALPNVAVANSDSPAAALLVQSSNPHRHRILTELTGPDFTDDAVRWLRRSYRIGALVDALAAIGMAVPRLYGPTLRFDRRFRRTSPEFTYAMRSGAPLMAGWTVLLLWADRRPLERRGVLPITVVPVIGGLMANDAHAVRAGRLSGASVAPVRALQFALIALFGYSAAKAQIAVRAADR